MKDIEDLKEQYRPLSKLEIKVPERTKVRIFDMINSYEQTSSSSVKHRRRITVGQRVAAIAMAVVIAGGLGWQLHLNSSSYTRTSGSSPTVTMPNTSQIGGMTSTIPANIAWNGYYYQTQGSVAKAGKRLGTANYPGPVPIYSIPGKAPNQEIAAEVDTPNAKFVAATRVPIGTKSAPIPDNWMSLDSPQLEQSIQPGETLLLSGNVFFRELYGTTITVELKERGSPGFITKRTVQVSQSGVLTGKLVVPTTIPKAPRYLLVFHETSKQFPTTAFSFPLT